MFDFAKDAKPSSKCFFTHCRLPTYIDEEQPPTRRPPFSTCLAQKCSHTMDLLLPSDAYDLLREQLEGEDATLHYCRVIMSLSDIISGDFFNMYIKTGNIIMLSEGRRGVDNWYFLHEGILRLEVDKATYERAGLVGKPIPDHGQKHKKARFAIELNLRLPSMLHGKKGFDRIVWACKNVLNHSVSWLFIDVAGKELSGLTPEPLSRHHPFKKVARPELCRIANAMVPIPAQFPRCPDAEEATEILEWISLANSDSPRIRSDDSIDAYLSRYVVPSTILASSTYTRELIAENDPPQQSLVRLRWHGFIPACFALKIWTMVRKRSLDRWSAVTVHGFNYETVTLLTMQQKEPKIGQEVLVWQT